MANQVAARLSVALNMDSSEFSADVDKAISETRKLKRTLDSEMKAAEKEVQRIKHAMEDYGKEVTAVTLMQRQLSAGGRYAESAKAIKGFSENMLKQAAALDAVRLADKKLMDQRGGMSAGMSRYLKQALAYQTTDIVTSLAGGQNPLLVMLQQGGQLRDQFGGFKELFKGIAEVVTITRLAFVGAATAIAVLAYGFYKGSQESAKFRDDLILTNNFAGVTANSFNKLAFALSDNLKMSVTDTKAIFSALVASGSITSKNLESVAQVIANISKLSGESAESVASTLLPAMDGTASSAQRLNEKYHFLNLEQYKHIELLNKQGKLSEALNFQNELLNKSFEDQERKLGLVEKAWNEFLGTLGNVKSALFSIGKEAGDSELLDAAVKKLRTTSLVYGMAESPERKKAMDTALADYQELQDKLSGKDAAAIAKSDKAAEEQRRIKNWKDINGLQTSLGIQANMQKRNIEGLYQASLFGANEMERHDIESAKRIALKTLETQEINDREKYQLSALRYKDLAEFVIAEEKKTAQEKERISIGTYLSYEKKNITEKNSLDMEKQRLGIYQSNFFITEQEALLAERKLSTQQKIAEIVRDMNNGKLGSDAASELIKQQEEIGKTKDEIIGLGEKLQYVKDVNQAVFTSMTQAIQAFLITGKMSFKDFATSVIANLLQIQAQYFAMSAMRGFGSLFGGGGVSTFDIMSANMSSDPIGSLIGSIGGKAAGGYVSGPTLVGENGPELFVPNGAGTIIPNQRMNDYGSGQAQNVFNGPYIANMSAIDTQSGTQFLAKNKMTIWSLNQSANRSVPASR